MGIVFDKQGNLIVAADLHRLQHGDHPVAHNAVAQRARAAGVVAGHAADGGAARRRDVDREPELVSLELLVQLVEDDPRLHDACHGLGIDGQHVAQILGEIDDEGAADRLAALRGAAAAGQERQVLGVGDLDNGLQVRVGLRDHDAKRFDLVDRSIRAVAAAAEGVEQHLALNGGFQ